MITPSRPYRSLLLVDGYNVICSWASLKKINDRHGLEPAREKLVETLIGYTHHQDYKTLVVFDAYIANTPANHEQYTSHLSVYYTAHEQKADTYIEKFCADYRREKFPGSPKLIVATSDNAQKLTVTGYGAICISARELEAEVELTGRQLKNHQKTKKQSRGRYLFHSLDAGIQKKLEILRHGIETPKT